MILAAWSVPALAAPNEHGQLFFHARPDLVYSSAGNPAGQSDLSDCRDAETTVPLGEESIVWYVLAAFPPEIVPRVGGVEFGIAYDETHLVIDDYGFAPSTVYRTADYPAPGSSVRVYFDEEKTEILFEIGWFAGAPGTEPSVFTIDPQHSNRFWRTPSWTSVERTGTLGFGTEGSFLCNPLYACCLRDGTCVIEPDFVCEARDGTIYGDPTCSPDPCLSILAGCCLPSDPEECAMLTQEECANESGTFMGVDSTCPPQACVLGPCCLDGANPGGCEILPKANCLARGGFPNGEGSDPDLCFSYCCCGPVEESSWGSVKVHFR